VNQFSSSFPQLSSGDDIFPPDFSVRFQQIGGDGMKTTQVTQYLALGALLALSISALGQKDPGVRGGIQNTGGRMQQQGIPIPDPPVISPHPTTGAIINDNEFASFLEGILRAGQLESTCDDCADVTDGSPVVNMGGGTTKPAWMFLSGTCAEQLTMTMQ
jgi:hypothetical protein